MPRSIYKRERVDIAEVSAILGVSIRTIQRLAARHELPSAAKVGRIWTFNEAAIRAWLVDQENKPPSVRIERRPRTDAAGAQVRPGRASWSSENDTVSASKRLIQSLRATGKQQAKGK